MPLTSGTKLGPYEIQSPIGAGGMGEVYRARDARLNRDVAIKILPASFSADAERLQRFAQESRAAAALNHPNILSIFDIGEANGAPYVVSELLEGETLRDRLRNGALPSRKAIDYGQHIASGLAAAHEKGIVHRDLKPENIFVTSEGRVKILDFGLAKLTQPEADLSGDAPTQQVGTEAGTVMGTVGYMSPEQVRGKATDSRSDIFSFGAVLYEMLSGKRAFHGDSAVDTMSAILKEEPPDSRGDQSQRLARARTHRPPLPGEKSSGTFSVRARRCLQPRCSYRYLYFQSRRRTRADRRKARSPLASAFDRRGTAAGIVGRCLPVCPPRRCAVESDLPRSDLPQRDDSRRALCARRTNHCLRRRLGRKAARDFFDPFR